jgi:hypothetical protein
MSTGDESSTKPKLYVNAICALNLRNCEYQNSSTQFLSLGVFKIEGEKVHKPQSISLLYYRTKDHI